MMRARRHPVLEEDLGALVARDLPWRELEGQTVLVTGAAGLVGGYLVEALLYWNEVSARRPCTVLALVRDEARAAARFAHHRGHGDLRLVVQDVCAPLPGHLDPTYVIHGAGNATPGRFAVDPIGTYLPATLGTHQLLERAHRAGALGFLLLSTGAVHGELGDGAVLDERAYGVVDPLDPYSCYAESKRMAETMCASWARQRALPTRMARLGHTYGPGLRRDDDRAFAQFVFAAVDGRDIELRSDGSAVRPYCYLSDAADALLRVLLRGGDGEPYLVANPDASWSVRELAELLAGMSGRRVRTPLRGSDALAVVHRAPHRPVDVSKLRALGWAPSVGVEEGFRRTVRSCA